MDGYLRLRQICLVAPALRPAEEGIAAVLGVAACFRDPGVGRFGLENALFPLGTGVLEVVAPVREGTAAGRFLERSGGRGGYMVILDCDDPERRRAHAEALGLRIAHEYRHEGYLGVQLHPRDARAAMIEFNRTAGGEALDGPYHPAGPDWPSIVRRGGRGPRLLAVEVEGPDPAGLAAHWARIMEVPVASAADGGARCRASTCRADASCSSTPAGRRGASASPASGSAYRTRRAPSRRRRRAASVARTVACGSPASGWRYPRAGAADAAAGSASPP